MKRFFLSGILTILLVLPVSTVSANQSEDPLVRFSDVAASHPNAEAIAYLKANGIVQGYSDGSFGPERTITRAEFVKIFVEAYFKGQADVTKGSEYRSCFNDIEVNSYHEEWFSKYACFAKDHGIVSGYTYFDSIGRPLSVFSPGQDINFAEAAKIVANTAKLDVRTPDSNLPWYKPYSDALSRSSAIPASIRSYTSSVTRGEMAEIIYRLKANVTDKPSLNYPELALFTILKNANGWSIKHPTNYQLVANDMAADPEHAESVEIQQDPPETVVDPTNGVTIRKSLSISKVKELEAGQTFASYVQAVFHANQERGYSTSGLQESAYFGLQASQFRVNHAYASNATDGFLVYPEQEVIFLLRGSSVFRVMYPVQGDSNGMPYAAIMFATLIFDE